MFLFFELLFNPLIFEFQKGFDFRIGPKILLRARLPLALPGEGQARQKQAGLPPGELISVFLRWLFKKRNPLSKTFIGPVKPLCGFQVRALPDQESDQGIADVISQAPEIGRIG